ncbi:MAG: ABC transporter substrate-binding protein, partial [Beijerinckiaceae bacterium]
MTAGALTINAGFIPLIDAAVPLAAAQRGFAESEGIHLALNRESSWANIRDKTAVGHFDLAHMLAPMPIATNLGLDPLPSRLIVPMALGLNGNTIVVSNDLHRQMAATGSFTPGDPVTFAQALGRVVRRQDRRPVFAVVHPVSAHR